MQKKILPMFVVFCLGLLACNTDSNEPKTKEIVKTPVPQEEEHIHEHSEKIELNSGLKWKVSNNMMPHMMANETLLTSYIKRNRKDYQQLAKELTKNNDLFIENCSMQGKSHDELHKWLEHHLELTDELTEAKNQTEAQKTIKELALSFKEFHVYFE